ncbi:MAG: FAD-dependent oxidoreductase, partial [Myxococcales bacterium]|nr:FAD-dependent oxidoreductase [Myxococcales bacterium]
MAMMLEVEIVVIGGGVVGMACARELARAGREVLLLERHAGAGRETTSRNSEVLHAGIYYPAGSLKAELCLRGLELCYETCARLSLPHRRCGKLIVAVEEDEREALEALRARALAAGARELSLIEGAALSARA